MKLHTIIALNALCIFAATAKAQQIFPVSPINTFYRTSNDPGAVDSYSLPIGAFGVQPGDWLKLRCVGDWNNGVAGEVLRDMVGCFTANGILLSSTLQHRFPLPIPTGPAFVPDTGTANGNLPMDINEDFWISRSGYVNEVNIQVPPGSIHLWLAVPDIYYSDNTDLDANLGVEVTVISHSAYPGTLEDSELGSAVTRGTGIVVLDHIDTKTALAGDLITAALRSPFGTQASTIGLILADISVTPNIPIGPLPNTYFGIGAAIALPFVLIPAFGLQSVPLVINVPPNFAGFSLWLQGGTISTIARNTFCTITNAHQFRLR
jgi:hypothetical protein